jgi:hypothetical protein
MTSGWRTLKIDPDGRGPVYRIGHAADMRLSMADDRPGGDDPRCSWVAHLGSGVKRSRPCNSLRDSKHAKFVGWINQILQRPGVRLSLCFHDLQMHTAYDTSFYN